MELLDSIKEAERLATEEKRRAEEDVRALIESVRVSAEDEAEKKISDASKLAGELIAKAQADAQKEKSEFLVNQAFADRQAMELARTRLDEAVDWVTKQL